MDIITKIVCDYRNFISDQTKLMNFYFLGSSELQGHLEVGNVQVRAIKTKQTFKFFIRPHKSK